MLGDTEHLVRCPECGRFVHKRAFIERDGSGPSTIWWCNNPNDEGDDGDY
jgi:hypothetical protein